MKPNIPQMHGHTPWFDARYHRPARSGWFEYYDAMSGAVRRVYWDRKRQHWCWDENIVLQYGAVGDFWRGLTLDGYVVELEA